MSVKAPDLTFPNPVPTPLPENCSIDLEKKIIQIYELNARLVDPLLERIPGKITCKMTLGMGNVVGWYRDESNTLTSIHLQWAGWISEDTENAEKLRTQMKLPDNTHFTVMCVPRT